MQRQVRTLEATRTSDSAAAPAEVMQLALAPAGDQLAAGYADGSVRVWNLATYDCTVTLSGHKVPGLSIWQVHLFGSTVWYMALSITKLARLETDLTVPPWRKLNVSFSPVSPVVAKPVLPTQSAVTALRFNSSGALLASGAKDTDVIIWDVVGETGMFRLRGHHDQARILLDPITCMPHAHAQ